MTITLGFWSIPIAIIVVAVVAAFIIDSDLREGNTGLLSGCLGFTVIAAGIVLAAGISLGRLLS